MHKNKKAVSLFLVFVMMLGINTNTFASEDDNAPQITNSDISIGESNNISSEVYSDISAEELQTLSETMKENITYSDGSFEAPNLSTIINIQEESAKVVEFNKVTRDAWLVADDVFVTDGQLSASNTLDTYRFSTTTGRTPVLKINSGDSNVLAQLFIIEPSGEIKPTSFIDQAGDSKATIAASLLAGDYILAVGSENNTSVAAYTLMWNCSNPEKPNRVIYASPNLDLVTLGYENHKIMSNGINLLNPSNLNWEEEYTFTTGGGYSHRSQDISEVRTGKLHLGRFSTNKYSTNNALFIEVAEETLWAILRSEYINGSTHIMNWNDATGRKTPRRLDATDMKLGPHFIVIDLEKNLIVDFASPYNYLWQSGEIKGSATITASDI